MQCFQEAKEGTKIVPFCYVSVGNRKACNLNSMKTKEEINRIAEEIIQGSDLFVVEVKISKNDEIEILIDSPQGVNLSTCAQISRQLEARLDRDAEDFTLTVASAGIGFPFRVAGQYRKNIGKKVVAKLTDSTRMEGILKAYDGESVTLVCKEKRTTEGKKKKETIEVEKILLLTNIKEIKDIVSF